jgi:hypothetical protein
MDFTSSVLPYPETTEPLEPPTETPAEPPMSPPPSECTAECPMECFLEVPCHEGLTFYDYMVAFAAGGVTGATMLYTFSRQFSK